MSDKSCKDRIDFVTVNRHIEIMDLREFLTENHITIYDLAKRSGIPRTTLNDVINGKTVITECRYSTLSKMAGVLGIPVEAVAEEDVILYPETGDIHSDHKRKLDTRNQSGCTGVCFKSRKGLYEAYIQINGRNTVLGAYHSFDEAVAARKAAERIRNILENMQNKD